MSRVVKSQASKAVGKANRANDREEKAADLAMGLNSTMKKAIGDDVVLCTVCGATKKGPGTCSCKGGVTKPGPDFDSKRFLLAAAQQRHDIEAEAKKKERGASGAATKKARDKKKDGGDGLDDPDLILQGEDDILQVIEFPVGKLGFSLERYGVTKVTEGGTAADLGVKVGWILRKINGEDVVVSKSAKKMQEAIQKQTVAAMKLGPVKFGFSTPLEEGQHHCRCCDKFINKEEYNEEQLDKGPGQQICSTCEEYDGMFG